MSAEHVKSLTLEQEPSFPRPIEDRLGLAKDPIYLSSRKTPDGQEFVLVHSRPFLGEAMFAFLNTLPPYRKVGLHRRHAVGVFTPVEDRHHLMDKPGREFSDEMEAKHSSVSKYGIGETYMSFGRDVRRDWAKAFTDSETDTVYTPLSSLIAISNFDAFRDRQISKWIPNDPDYEGFSRHRPGRVAEMINKIYGLNRDWPIKYAHPYAALDQNIRDFIESLDNAERDNLVGRAMSEYADPGFSHWPCHNLVLDLTGQRHWYRPFYKYGGFDVGVTNELEFPIPTVDFDGVNGVTISNQDNVFVRLRFGEPNDKIPLSPWQVDSYRLPESYYSAGRYAAVAWKQDNAGGREFFDQGSTVEAVRKAGIPIPGTPDSYLGKLLVRYFRQLGEYQESKVERKWVTEMGLPGSSSKRHITQRELPVWIQLPQHQQDLLHSNFLITAERLVS